MANVKTLMCASATGDVATQWTQSSGTVTADTGLVFGTNAYSWKLNTGSPAVSAFARVNGVLADAGRRISWWVYFPSVSPAAQVAIALTATTASAQVHLVYLNTNGTLALQELGATNTNGTKVLSPNTLYRLTLSYTITNSTTHSAKLYIDGAQEISVANSGTLTNTGTDKWDIHNSSASGANFLVYHDEIYIDDGTDLGDPGNIRVAAKRPNANGTTNGFTTQIGSGGSGYGSGHSPQVNERPLSQTNGWSMVGAGSAITEQYNIENIPTGDNNLNSAQIIDYAGWVFAKSLSAETASIIVNNVSSNISLTSTATYFPKVAGSTTYPAGSGKDIGIITATTLTTVSLYECGIIVAYIPPHFLAMMGVGS